MKEKRYAIEDVCIFQDGRVVVPDPGGFDLPADKAEDLLIEWSIGFNDKNGNKIYVGDFLLDPDLGQVFGPVYYEPPSFNLREYNNGDFYLGEEPLHHDWESMELSGNIHDEDTP